MDRAPKTAIVGLAAALLAILVLPIVYLVEGPPPPENIRESCEEFCVGVGCVLVEIHRNRFGRASCICAVADPE